jgi:hypothetical protein
MYQMQKYDACSTRMDKENPLPPRLEACGCSVYDYAASFHDYEEVVVARERVSDVVERSHVCI